MFRRAVLSSALAVAAVMVTAAPVTAAPTLPPPGPETLWVTAYYSSPEKKPTQLVGQRWHGCGRPTDRWGIVTSYVTVYHPLCTEG
jgi:hypothetical protein